MEKFHIKWISRIDEKRIHRIKYDTVNRAIKELNHTRNSKYSMLEAINYTKGGNEFYITLMVFHEGKLI